MIGRTISHYRITERLGQGGMGVVYRAEDLKLGRTVALKFLGEGPASRAERMRLVREARAAAALDHPNICTIHEIDEADGHTFIAMALVQGRSLADRIAQGPLPLPGLIDIASQIAAGLSVAHAQQIVHRDIKSANVMLTPEGQVKIMDFGLAQLPDQTALTQSGTVVGTSTAMSPEQALGQEVDRRSDLWSLGVIIYEMITGGLPFQGETAQALLYNVIHTEPQPPTALRTGVPLELDHLVLKALAKDPAERYQSAEDMMADLRRLARSESDSGIQPVSLSRQTGPTRPRQQLLRAISWSSLLLVPVLIVGLLVLTPSKSIPFSERDWILITDFENLTGEEVFQGTIREALAIDLQQSQYVNIFSGKRLEDALYRSGRSPGQVIDAKLGREIAIREGITAILEGSISKIGQSYLLSAKLVNPSSGDAVNTKRVKAKDQEKVLVALDNLSRDIRKNLGESLLSIGRRDQSLDKVSTPSLQALEFYSKGRQLTSQANWEEAIPLLKAAIAADSSFAIAYHSLAVLYHNLNRTTDALHFSDQAHRYNERVTEREKYHIEAEYYRIRDDYTNAIEQYMILLQLYPDDFNAHNNLCFTYQYTRQYDLALTHAHEVNRLYPESWYAHHNLALVQAGLGNYPAAIQEFELGLQIYPQAFWSRIGLSWIHALNRGWEQAWAELEQPTPRGHEWDSLKQNGRSILHLYRGEFPAALDALDQAVEADRRTENVWAEAAKLVISAEIDQVTGQNNDTVKKLKRAAILQPSASVLAALGRFHARQGEMQEANAVLARLDTLVASQPTNLNRAYRHTLLGQIAWNRGDSREAVQEFETSLALNPSLVTYLALGDCYLELGELEKAQDQFDYLVRQPWAAFFDGVPHLWCLAHCRLGRTHDAAGNAAAALENFDIFLGLWEANAPDDHEVKYALGRAKVLREEVSPATQPRH